MEGNLQHLNIYGYHDARAQGTCCAIPDFDQKTRNIVFSVLTDDLG